MTTFLARRAPAGFTLSADGFDFGLLRSDPDLGGWTFVDKNGDVELEGAVNHALKAEWVRGIESALSEVKGAYVAFWAEQHAIAAAETYAENAWLRAAEYDPAQEGFEAWERANGVIERDAYTGEAV